MNSHGEQNTLANRLRRCMTKMQCGIEHFAELCGVPPSLIMDIVDGLVTQLDDDPLIGMALGAKKTPSWIQRGIASQDLRLELKGDLHLADLDSIYFFCSEREVAEPLRQRLSQKALEGPARQRRHVPLSQTDLAGHFREVLGEVHPVSRGDLCPVTEISCSWGYLCRSGNCVYLRSYYLP